jgi:FMN phosphatase YigB (HAD superfamily)
MTKPTTSGTPLIILDFDGTFTDAEVEGAPFVTEYVRQLSSILGRDIHRFWREAESALSNPEIGWLVDGQVVAPANCDPYIRATCLAFEVCDRLGVMDTPRVRTEVLHALYAYCYEFTRTAFRPEAKDVLRELASLTKHIYVVTNASTKTVEKKLESLGLNSIQVRGSARKYVVAPHPHSTPTFEALVDITVSGLQRKLLVRRPYYFDILHELWATSGATPASTLVCGDIFELDLALPASLGAQGHLLIRANTLDYEKRAASQFSGLTMSDNLTSLVARVKLLLQSTPPLF